MSAAALGAAELEEEEEDEESARSSEAWDRVPIREAAG